MNNFTKCQFNDLLSDISKQELVIGWSMKSDRKTFVEMYWIFKHRLREK
jgi:hypothetical protein